MKAATTYPQDTYNRILSYPVRADSVREDMYAHNSGGSIRCEIIAEINAAISVIPYAIKFRRNNLVFIFYAQRQRSGDPTPCGGYPATPCSV